MRPTSVTFVPAVTYSPASTTQSSPSGMPMPAFAPRSERSPIVTTCVPLPVMGTDPLPVQPVQIWRSPLATPTYLSTWLVTTEPLS